VEQNKENKEDAIVECLDYQIPATQLDSPKRYGDKQEAKRDCNAQPTRDLSTI